MPLTAVTFDMWDVLVVDDSDEPERARRSLPPKSVARRQLFTQNVLAATSLSPAAVDEAWDLAQARFTHQWKVEHRTPGVADRLQVALDHLGIGPPPGFDAMVAAMESMEVELPPRATPGMRDALDVLAGRYRLGIISDAIVTPGRGLRKILDQHGMLQFFSHIVYSDEAGASKPAARVFQLASAGLDAPFDQMAHIGDREHNDVDGPLAVGMKAVLFTAVVDRGSDRTRAHAVCSDPASLPDILAAL